MRLQNIRHQLLFLGLIATTLTNAEELGRLFFTPQQRAMLKHGQHPDIGNLEQPGQPDQPDQPAIAESLTVSGIVQKDGGERTVWINGVPQVAGKSDEQAPGSIPVAVPGQSQPVRVKVGQKLLLETPPQPKTAGQKSAEEPSQQKPPAPDDDDD